MKNTWQYPELLQYARNRLQKEVNDEEGGTFKIGTELNDTILKQILDANIYTLSISVTNSINKGPYQLTPNLNDKNNTKDESISEFYKMLRPGEPRQ